MVRCIQSSHTSLQQDSYFVSNKENGEETLKSKKDLKYRENSHFCVSCRATSKVPIQLEKLGDCVFSLAQ